MKTVHGSSLDDPELLHQIVLQELKIRGIEVRLDTPKPSKKSFVPFSTPATGNATPGASNPASGRIFGRRLSDLSKLLVSLHDSQDIDVLVPKLIVSACKYIEENVEIEGIYRLSGSAARQKAMRKEMDCHDTDFREMVPAPSVLDVAALLKQFLRELPLPIVPRIFHLVLASSFSSPPALRLENLLLCLLLLPSEHLASLSFLLRHLHLVAKASNVNKMTAANLAIVLSPNLLPVQDNVHGSNSHKVDRKVVESNSQRLKLHTDMLEVMILNSDNVGYVTQIILERYNACISIQSFNGTSHSEDNLDDDNVAGPSRRKTKKKTHIRRRSGSLSRVLSSIGKSMKKAIGHESSVTPGGKADHANVHSTPLPSHTPDFSPRGNQAKRKANAEHELSPSNKAQKRTFESTFTPKMRTRTFSVKRFKRKKSEGKFKPVNIKETFVSYNEVKVTPRRNSSVSRPSSSPEVRKIQTRSFTASAATTPDTTLTQEAGMDLSKTNEGIEENNEDFEEQYAEVKAQFNELEQEIGELERTAAEDGVTERFEVACAAGHLARESRETARQMARVRRSSSHERKPRSPSQRRIGVIRRRSREREQKMSSKAGVSPERSELTRAPSCKPCLTPLNLDKSSVRSRLQRGQPNSTSVGLEKPISSPGYDSNSGKARIKMSFKEKERPNVNVKSKSSKSPRNRQNMSAEKKKLSHGDSIASLKNDLSDMIEKSFGSEEKTKYGDDEVDEVFDNTLESRSGKTDLNDLSSKLENISFKNQSPPMRPEVDDFFVQSSPVTRSQMRRVSDCFEFARPDDVPSNREETLRRQSSAFEFRSKFANAAVEPTYENLSRDVATRGSLRRRNSSVRDLVQKIESETRKRSIDVPPVAVPTKPPASKPPSHSSTPISNVSNRNESGRPVPDLQSSRVATKPPLRISSTKDEEFTDGWVDASEFFKNVTQVEAPQCGRSSIVKIRTQIQGRVKDSVTKFSGQPGATPVRAGASRRLSARMGTCVTTPGGHVRPPKMSTALPPVPVPGGTRRQTLTGIKTTAAAPNRRLSTANYANPTIASTNRASAKSPVYEPVANQSRKGARPRSKSPRPSATKSPKPEPSYQNVKVERTNSNSRDIKRHPVERSSSAGSKSKKNRVRRNRSDAESRARRREEKNSRRYLTIGYPGEVRSPLKERQNIPANVRRSESDRTPSRPSKNIGDSVMTRGKLQEVENLRDYENIALNTVVRKHSLKCDMLMSPKPQGHILNTPLTASRQVKRAASERQSTPRGANRITRSTPKPMMSLNDHRMMNMELMKTVAEGTPRRSPRFSMI